MKANLRQSFLFNLGIILLICLLLYIAFFATLKSITRHGEEVMIPDLRGKDINVAGATLKSMHFEISIDSTYDPDMKPLTVLKQVPDTGSIVKQGRTVFLTVNRIAPPHIAMPALVNLSFRSAEMLLRNNKLKLGDTISKPDIAAGAVLDMLCNGQPIKPGDLVAQGSKISLVIGDGLGNTTFNVPDVLNLSVEDAEIIINNNNLQYNIQLADPTGQVADTSQLTVIDQSPLPTNEGGAHNTIKAGGIIDLKVK